MNGAKSLQWCNSVQALGSATRQQPGKALCLNIHNKPSANPPRTHATRRGYETHETHETNETQQPCPDAGRTRAGRTGVPDRVHAFIGHVGANASSKRINQLFNQHTALPRVSSHVWCPHARREPAANRWVSQPSAAGRGSFKVATPRNRPRQ